jgi:hypothetical protein
MRRVPSQKRSKSTATTKNRIRMMRSIWNHVPSKKIAGGKKSARVGALKPPPPVPSSVAAGSRRLRA